MGHILIITSGLTGIVNASMELAKRLQSSGHSITMSSVRDKASVYEANNFAYTQLPWIDTDADLPYPAILNSSPSFPKVIYRRLFQNSRRKQAYQRAYPSEYLEKIKDLQPDLIVLDTELHEFIIPTYASKYSMLILSQWFQLGTYDGLPYQLHDIIPGQGNQGSNSAIAADWKEISKKRTEIFDRKSKDSLGTDRRSVLYKMMEEFNFPQKYIGENNWPGPYTYKKLPFISMTAGELEFPYKKPDWYTNIGAMVYKERVEKQLSPADEVRLENILRKENDKLIVCTISTLHAGDTAFIKKVIAAVAKLDGYRLLIGLGGLVSKSTLGKLPANTTALAYIPMLKVLPYADLSINHAGIHSINECIEYAVPMLVYSGKRSDQNGCAARVHYHKLGIMGDKDKDTAQNIANNIKAVLSKNMYAENIKKHQQISQDYKESQVLQSIISTLLKIK